MRRPEYMCALKMYGSGIVRHGGLLLPLLLLLLVSLSTGCIRRGPGNRGDDTKIGVLHSLTGTMAISEKDVVDATLMAIEEINAQGGVLGRRLRPIVADGHSDWPTFSREAERLIVDEKV